LRKPRGTNVRATVKIGEPSGATTLRQARIADMAALEQLPLALRWLLNELTIELSAGSVLAYLRSIERQARQHGGSVFEAETWTCRKLAQIEADDLDAFDQLYRREAGLALPHVAAGVSVLRYGPLEGSTRLRAVPRGSARRLFA
jgi:hypothetical protein